VKEKYSPNFSPLLVAMKIFEEERNIRIEDIYISGNPYFYILALNLKFVKCFDNINDRKWIPLISKIITEVQ